MSTDETKLAAKGLKSIIEQAATSTYVLLSPEDGKRLREALDGMERAGVYPTDDMTKTAETETSDKALRFQAGDTIGGDTIEELRGKIGILREKSRRCHSRIRGAAHTLIEEIGGQGPEDLEKSVARAVRVIQELRAVKEAAQEELTTLGAAQVSWKEAFRASEQEVERLRELVTERERDIRAVEEEADLQHEKGSLAVIRTMRSRLTRVATLAEMLHDAATEDINDEYRKLGQTPDERVNELENCIKDAKNEITQVLKNEIAQVLGVSLDHPLTILAQMLVDDVKGLRSKLIDLQREGASPAATWENDWARKILGQALGDSKWRERSLADLIRSMVTELANRRAECQTRERELKGMVQTFDAEEENWKGEVRRLTREVYDRDKKIRALEEEADQSHDKVTYKEAETRIPDPVTLADVLRRTSATGHLLDLREKVEELRVRWRHTCFTESAELDLQVFILLGLYRAMCVLLELEPDVEGHLAKGA